MPWSNQGGSNGNGNQGGPWGQGPKRPNGGGGGGQQPPDLEDIIKQGQDKIKQLFPGGSVPGGSNRFIWLIVIVALAGIVLMNSFYRVQADEQGVVLQLGKYNRTAGPGLHFAVWPVESVEILQVTKEHNLTFGGRNASEGLMLAGDQNIVDIRFTVQWRIADAKKYLFNIQQPVPLIRVIAESAMRDVVGRTPAETVRTKGRLDTQDQVLALIQKTLNSYDSGIKINGVQLEQADPPPQVVDAFEEVQRAEQEQNKLIREAERYRNKLLGEARGDAARIVENAKAYKARVVAESQGEAQRFIKVYEEYAKAKDVTRERLFLETMERVLSKSNKVIVDGKGGNGVVPYLPLPEVQKRTNSGGQQ